MLRSSLLLLLVSTLTITAAACGSGSSGSAGPSADPPATGGSVGASCKDATAHTGEGTYYAADGSGNCSFDPTGDLMVGAMNHADYADSAACGACVHITGPSGEVTVRIVDQCPECKPGDIDLSPEAFSKFADLPLGRVKIDWKYVPCEVEGPLVYHFKEGSNQWWTAVQVRNARAAIATFEFKRDGQYVPVNRTDYNYFLDEAGMGPGPYTFRVTDVDGNVVEDSGVPFKEAGDAPGGAQLAACGQ